MSDEAMNNYTPRAQQVLSLARKEAGRLNHNFVGTEHVLLGLLELRQGVGFNVLKRLNFQPEVICLEVEKLVGTGPDQSVVGVIPYTPRVKKVLSLASKEAKALKHTYVGTEHILLGLLREGDGVAFRVLSSLGLDIEILRQEVLKELDPSIKSEQTTERKDVSTKVISNVPARYIAILYLATDDMPFVIVRPIDEAKLEALGKLVGLKYFQTAGIESAELIDKVVRGSGNIKVLELCARLYESLLMLAASSRVERLFMATEVGSLEERRFGTVLQIIIGKPVQRTVTMDFLTEPVQEPVITPIGESITEVSPSGGPVPVVTPSGGLV